MANPIVDLILFAIVVAVAIKVLRPNPAFVVELREGRAVPKRGSVPKPLLRECEAVQTMHELPDGWIKAYRTGSAVRLQFSRSIPERFHQTFRNVWNSVRLG